MKIIQFLSLSLLLAMASCKPAKYAHLEEGMYADLETSKGTILLKLAFEKTPITVANFVSLAEGDNGYVADSLQGKPYYDGLTFHRVVNDFMIQGGCPVGNGTGSPGYQFSDEFPKDETTGELLLKHDRPGVLSMANSGPATNGSQFFITHKETPWLDGMHTVFGSVVSGQEVVDSIKGNDEIKHIAIVKVGRAAKQFKAAKTFSEHYERALVEGKEKMVKIKAVSAAKKAIFDQQLPKAISLPSGLQYVITHTEKGLFPKKGTTVQVAYSGYFNTGELFDTSYQEVAKEYGVYDERRDSKGGYAPFNTVYGPNARLIAGFKEGIQKMRIGDKALLFIPSHLGYGAQGAGKVIPPDTDLVFEVELVGQKK
ncbi:MAG: peptidylprolyl isomerase [Lutibacter sp.]|nr:peptidylprolyl isomerase [Lutibacter sp.]